MVDAVRTSMLANTSGGIDENLISRRSSKNKQGKFARRYISGFWC